MSSLSREIVFLVLQFLDEEKLKETVRKLEQESGFFFNMKYFEDEVRNGNWDEVERYLSGFTKVDDNRSSMKIYFEIIKQKDLEALYEENELLSKYGDTKSARAIMLVELKKLIEANPLFRDKLQFPSLKNSRLRTLINQGLNWQHQLCRDPKPNPDIKTLFADHTCGQPNGALAPSPADNPLLESIPKAGGFPPLGAHGPFQPTAAPVPTPLVGWMSNPSIVARPAVSGGAIGLGGPTNPEDLQLILLRLRSSTERKKEKERNVAAMSSLCRELVFLILQFLNEEKFKETVHELEQESGFYFNMKYFEDEVHNGNWDEAERYLSGFTKVDDNSYSMKIFLEIIKQKDLEALDKENEPLSKYGDTKSARTIMLVELKKLIEANPLFRDKLQFPNLKNSRLRTLINQSLNWQHQLCRNPRPNPDIKTLFADHTCGQPNGALAPSPANNPLLGSIPKAGGFPPLGAHGRRSLTTRQSKKEETSKDLVSSTVRVLFRLVFGLLIFLAAFYIYWNLSATINEIQENRTTVKQGISQFVIDAQGLIGWIHDESNSGFVEDGSGGKVGTARRILRFVG